MKSIMHMDIKTHKAVIGIHKVWSLMAVAMLIILFMYTTLVGISSNPRQQLVRKEMSEVYEIDNSYAWLAPSDVTRTNYSYSQGSYSSLTNLICQTMGGCINGNASTQVIETEIAINVGPVDYDLNDLGYAQGYNTTNIARVVGYKHDELNGYDEYDLYISSNSDCAISAYISSQAWFKKLGQSQGTDTFPSLNMLPVNVICRTGHNLSNVTSPFIVHDLINHNNEKSGQGSLSINISGTYMNNIAYDLSSSLDDGMYGTVMSDVANKIIINNTTIGTFITSRIYRNRIITCAKMMTESKQILVPSMNCIDTQMLFNVISSEREMEICEDENYSKMVGPYVQGQYNSTCIINHVIILASDCAAATEINSKGGVQKCISNIKNYEFLVDSIFTNTVSTSISTMKLSMPIFNTMFNIDLMIIVTACLLIIYLLLTRYINHWSKDKGLQAVPIVPLIISTTDGGDNCYTEISKANIGIYNSSSEYHNYVCINGKILTLKEELTDYETLLT